MTPDSIESLVQLGFAATIAGWLIYWLTHTIHRSLDNNTRAILGMQLFSNELYRLILQHDAQVRGVDPKASEDESEAHKLAAANYLAACQRLDELKLQIQKALERIDHK